MKTRKNGLKLLFLMVLVLCQSVLADDVEPLIDQYLGQITKSVWSPYQLKLSQLPANYISEVTDLNNGFEFSYFSYEGVRGCGSSSGVKNLVARISYEAIERSEAYIQERISYFGCRGRRLFSELRTRGGKDLGVINPKDVILGERSFVLADNEDFLHIQFVDEAGVIFFHSILERTIEDEEEAITARLYSFNYELLGLHGYTDKSQKEERLIMQVKSGYRISYSLHGRSFRSNWGGSGFNGYEIRRSEYETKSFIGETMSKPHLISENIFQQEYNQEVIPLFSYSAGSVLSLILNSHFLPPTEATSVAPSANREIIEEFQLNLNRVRLGVEPNLLEQFLLEYISGLESGDIVIQKRDN